ncbi:MAG: hypothetical protein QM762_23525 [Chryseolinea sp.]
MENDITNVTLSFCCKEDWNLFKTIDERSRFCATCKHRVVDFTNATASDFDHEKKSGPLCGRFKRSQLSAAFLLSLAAGVANSSCTEPDILPSNYDAPLVEEEQISVETEFIMAGIVSVPVSEGDSIAADEIVPLEISDENLE